MEVIDKANGFSLYSYVAEMQPEQQSQQILGMYAKSDLSVADMIDGTNVFFRLCVEMNEKYVTKDDDFEGLEDLLCCVCDKQSIAQNYVNS